MQVLHERLQREARGSLNGKGVRPCIAKGLSLLAWVPSNDLHQAQSDGADWQVVRYAWHAKARVQLVVLPFGPFLQDRS